MKDCKDLGISEDKLMHIIFMSRIANGMAIVPNCEVSEEDITEMCPAIKELNERIMIEQMRVRYTMSRTARN